MNLERSVETTHDSEVTERLARSRGFIVAKREHSGILHPMHTEIVPAFQVPVSDQVAVWNASFEGYIAGTIRFDAAGLARAHALHDVDPFLSRFALADGKPVGLIWLNRTGDVLRIAGMGVIPAARKSGIAKALLCHALVEAVDREDHLATLEVFEQNEPALALYRKLGFREVSRLYGWKRDAAVPLPTGGSIDANPSPKALPAGLLEIASERCSSEYPEIPWQISRHAALRAPHGAVAFANDAVRLVITSIHQETIRFWAILPTLCASPNSVFLRETIGDLMRRLPGRSWHAPAIYPESFGRDLFEPLGFRREPLNQVFMHIDV